MRVLPCHVASNIHTVLFPANATRQPIAYSSFHSKPSSIPPATLSYLAEFVDTASEYTIGLGASLRTQASARRVSHGFAARNRWADLFIPRLRSLSATNLPDSIKNTSNNNQRLHENGSDAALMKYGEKHLKNVKYSDY